MQEFQNDPVFGTLHVYTHA